MSHQGTDDEAERHRQAAAATEHHHKAEHHHSEHKSSGGGAYDKPSGNGAEAGEASFFVRHRSKMAAGLMVVLAVVFFSFVLGYVRL